MNEEKKFVDVLFDKNNKTVGKDTLASESHLVATEESGLPDTYKNTYSGKIDTAINNWLHSRGFDYNTNNDKDYHAYTNQYKKNSEAGSHLSENTAITLANGYTPTYTNIVSDEVYNRNMEDLSNTIPTYKAMAQFDYNAEQNHLGNIANIYAQLDSNDYSRYRDTVVDYKNQLNSLYNRYVANKQSDAEIDSYNSRIYDTKLSAAENNLEESRNYNLARYLYDTQSADSIAQIAQAEEENNQKIAYYKDEDAYNSYVDSLKNKGKTQNAEAFFASIGVTEDDFGEDGEWYDESGIENYSTYAKAYIDEGLNSGLIDQDERNYLYNKIGYTSDDESFNKDYAESYINAYLRKYDPELGEYVEANEDYILNQISIGLENGYISKSDAIYMLGKFNIDLK